MADKGAGMAAFIDVITTRRLLQQVADRIDRIGAILDAKVTADNGNAVAGWADTTAALITAAQTTPVNYIDPVTAKAFVPIK